MAALRRPGFRFTATMATIGALGALLALAVSTVAADPVGPVGTLTINDGSGYTNNPTLTLHVPATDAVALTTVEIYHDGLWTDPVPYTDTVELTLTDGDGEHHILARWTDVDANSATSGDTVIVLDRDAPQIQAPTLLDDPNSLDGLVPVGVTAADGSALASVRFSSNGTTWGSAVAWAPSVDWHELDPALGGSPRLGARTLYVEAADPAGNWSAPKSVHTSVIPRAPLSWSPDVPKTGHTLTITPNYPGAVTFPANTFCMWEVAWGDPQSLYYGNRDETFGFFAIRGPASAGYCAPLSFTVPWMPYRRMLVHYNLELGGDQGGLDEWVGSSPDDPAIAPEVDSTSRLITHASMPLVYVLPEDYVLIVGQPTTYRAYAVAGASVTSKDLWSVTYIDVPLQHLGGTSFTFTPDRTGDITVCWGTDSTKATRWSACYDPPARYADHTRPVAKAPDARVGTGTVPGASVPATVAWSATDRGWGVKSYLVQRSVDGGTWHTWASTTAKSRADALTVGHSYRYRVRATDKAGNVGAWATGPVIRPGFVSDANTSISYGGAWATAADATARNGSVHETQAASASARYRFSGRDIAWIAKRDAAHGAAKVYIDGILATTVDLAAAGDDPCRIVFRRHWSAVGTHTIKIVVVGTVGRPAVDIDGFVVLR